MPHKTTTTTATSTTTNAATEPVDKAHSVQITDLPNELIVSILNLLSDSDLNQLQKVSIFQDYFNKTCLTYSILDLSRRDEVYQSIIDSRASPHVVEVGFDDHDAIISQNRQDQGVPVEKRRRGAGWDSEDSNGVELAKSKTKMYVFKVVFEVHAYLKESDVGGDGGYPLWTYDHLYEKLIIPLMARHYRYDVRPFVHIDIYESAKHVYQPLSHQRSFLAKYPDLTPEAWTYDPQKREVAHRVKSLLGSKLRHGVRFQECPIVGKLNSLISNRFDWREKFQEENVFEFKVPTLDFIIVCDGFDPACKKEKDEQSTQISSDFKSMLEDISSLKINFQSHLKQFDEQILTSHAQTRSQYYTCNAQSSDCRSGGSVYSWCATSHHLQNHYCIYSQLMKNKTSNFEVPPFCFPLHVNHTVERVVMKMYHDYSRGIERFCEFEEVSFVRLKVFHDRETLLNLIELEYAVGEKAKDDLKLLNPGWNEQLAEGSGKRRKATRAWGKLEADRLEWPFGRKRNDEDWVGPIEGPDGLDLNIENYNV
ncbi:hypothetical protein WICPIJ_004645 [Wickerhamomyces pijperi]|uniref:F-box domain-containing protein n=1 Tax=Wickerhamomyces pijperi TaxID=599730 RepID=A0A9P8Q7L6_WICPI|nr:hypothetical protein WICPIJ_004645 [Wickerhamomyces pijperi]